MTPLHVAAEKGDRLDIVEYLISKEADINITDDNGVSETNDRTGVPCPLFMLKMMDKYSWMLTFKPMTLTNGTWQTCESQCFHSVCNQNGCLYSWVLILCRYLLSRFYGNLLAAVNLKIDGLTVNYPTLTNIRLTVKVYIGFYISPYSCFTCCIIHFDLDECSNGVTQ